MFMLTARYDRSAALGDAACAIQGKDVAWRLEGWQWRRVERRLGVAFAELRDPTDVLIRYKALDSSLEAAVMFGSEINVEFLPDDHPSRQSDVMTPAKFLIVSRYGKTLFSSRMAQGIMLHPEQTVTVQASMVAS